MGSIFYTKRLQAKAMPDKKKGSKSFSSEEAAKKYAEENKITNYELVNLRVNAKSKKPKIKIVQK